MRFLTPNPLALLAICLGTVVAQAAKQPPVVSASALSPSNGSKPNIIFIMTDDQGYGDLACMGNPILKTPHLNRFYEQSNRFTDFQVSPTIAFFGDNDKHVPVATAQAYKKRMEAQGQRCDLFIYEGQGHGFFNYRAGGDPVKNQYFNETLEEAAAFLQSLGYINGQGK